MTLDGRAIELLANIEMPGDAAARAGGRRRRRRIVPQRISVHEPGHGELPGEDEQSRRIALRSKACRGLPVTIRTVDIGADKPMDRMTASECGTSMRSIRRWACARFAGAWRSPACSATQLRAILRASAFGKVHLLIPMVAHLSEITPDAGCTGDRAKQQLDEAGKAFGDVEVGAMIEVPGRGADDRRS